MKTCTQCGQPQSLANFNAKTKSGGYHSECRGCHNTRQALRYQANTQRVRTVATAWRAKRSEWYFGLKDMRPCTDCGIAYPWYVMQWDHLGDKEDHVSKLYANNASRDRILAEIAKCELTCANCHCIRTFQRAQLAKQEAEKHIAS